MNQFNLGNFINKLVNNYSLNNQSGGRMPNAPANPAGPDIHFEIQPQIMAQSMIQKTLAQPAILHTFQPTVFSDLKMNNLASLERGLYVKDLMNLPKDLEEVLVLMQNKMIEPQELTKVLTTNINLADLAELIQKGGKEAMNKLILVMANASKQGITDTSQLKDAIKFINASVSVAGKDDPSQILKSFMLLYLPWLPLQEGVDFDLEIEGSEGGEDGSELSITIMISTRNYGNVKATLILLAGNSISIIINCCDKFPKEELLKRIKEEDKSHSIQTSVSFEEKEMKRDENATPQAKVTMSNLKEVNPFMLLMANALIRHTIELDNEA